MKCYILRLDDASDYMDVDKWVQMENLLDKYNVKPLIGIIPNNQDYELITKYERNDSFWKRVNSWKNKGWELALHGYIHKYITEEGGINPINSRSEFAGVGLEVQCEKIRRGVKTLKEHGIEPQIFFAPSHTFDQNTLIALKKESDIRIISDTIANDVYYRDGIYFIPQQSGRVRNLPFKLVTFCYHPNNMTECDFEELELFLKKNRKYFIEFNKEILKDRKFGLLDWIYRYLYFIRR